MQYFFIVFLGLAWTILYGVHLFVYLIAARVFGFSMPHWQYVVGFLAISYFLASFGVRTTSLAVADWFYFITASWLGFIFIAFSSVGIYWLLRLITKTDSPFLLAAFLVLAVMLGVYALIQGTHLTTKTITVPMRGISEPVRIVHLSDIHVGTVHQEKYLRRIVTMTNELRPDLVLITGDLFDGSAPIDATILKPLDDIQAPSYFSNGNHEQYEGLDKVRATLEPLKLKLLENEAVRVGRLEIVGVNDSQSLPRGTTLGTILDSLPREENVPRIVMYHSPVQWNEARERGVDLMLSGHTHNGQIFPFTWLVKIFYPYIKGLYEEEGKYLHVSPGTGTWGPPMRLGSQNQVTLLELIPAS